MNSIKLVFNDSAYEDRKDLINRTKPDKVLKDKAYDIASNSEYDGYQRGLASMVYKFFDKKSTAYLVLYVWEVELQALQY